MSLMIVFVLISIIVMMSAIIYHKLISYVNWISPPPFPPVYMLQRDNIITLFCEGMWASHVHGSLYAGSKGMPIIKDGQILNIVDPHAPMFLHNIYPYPDFNETNYHHSSFDYFTNTQRFLTQFRYYVRGISAPIHHVDITKTSVSGYDDVGHYLYYLKKMIKDTPRDKKIVLFGNSRGASIIIIAIGQLTPEEQARISLAILEAPYDDIKSIFRGKVSNRMTDIGCYIISIFTKFNHDQPTPIDTIDKFPTNVPVAMITTKVDGTVSAESTDKLINKLRNIGVKVHLCELNNSPHAGMPIHDYFDQRIYGQFLEDMYELYTV